MNAQRNLFEGLKRRDRGMALAAGAHAEALEYARESAYLFAIAHGEVTVDDVVVTDEMSAALGNAAGSIFKEKHWKCVGFRKSARPTAHARIVRVWKLA